MSDVLSDFGATGEKARLFPVLADSSKEGRTLSLVLATLARVPEFSAAVLGALGQSTGLRTKVRCFTEVTFPKSSNGKIRPDGLIVVTRPKSRWTALVEAKVGNASVEQAQLEAYLKLAKEVGVDAVLTISNDFAAKPDHHPTKVDGRLTRSVELFHMSWFSLLTEANLLTLNGNIDDDDHTFMLNELERFLTHPSSGLKRFDSMGPQWKSVLDCFRQGASLSPNSDDAKAVVGDWHSELRDLCLLLSRKTGAAVSVKLPPTHRSDAKARSSHDAQALAQTATLQAELTVPNAAAPIVVEADMMSRTVRASMTLTAPKDKTRQGAVLNWLLSQLKELDETSAQDVRITTHWPRRIPATNSTLFEAREAASIHSYDDKKTLPSKFTVMKMMADGKKFSGRKTVVEALESLVVNEFYGDVGSKLKAWQAPAPKLREEPDEAPAEEA